MQCLSFMMCRSLVQIVSSRAFAVAREAQNGSGHEEWKMCVPLVDMLDHGGPCMFPNSPEPVRQDNVRSASYAADVSCRMLCNCGLGSHIIRTVRVVTHTGEMK